MASAGNLNLRRPSAWYDRWLISEADEELEKIGLERHGREIIRELNRVYEGTHILEKFADLLMTRIRAAHRAHGRSVRILDVGARDGTLLHLVGRRASSEGIPIELHGLEFRNDITRFAQDEARARGDDVRIRHEPSRTLEGIGRGTYDVVCSSFMLHHRTCAECPELLRNASGAARFGMCHLDLRRSAAALALTWLYLTARGLRRTRPDSVLSVRRAFRVNELASIAGSLAPALNVRAFGPLYLLAETPAG